MATREQVRTFLIKRLKDRIANSSLGTREWQEIVLPGEKLIVSIKEFENGFRRIETMDFEDFYTILDLENFAGPATAENIKTHIASTSLDPVEKEIFRNMIDYWKSLGDI